MVIIVIPRGGIGISRLEMEGEKTLCLIKGRVSFFFILRLTNTNEDLSRVLNRSLYKGKDTH